MPTYTTEIKTEYHDCRIAFNTDTSYLKIISLLDGTVLDRGHAKRVSTSKWVWSRFNHPIPGYVAGVLEQLYQQHLTSLILE